MFIVLSTVLEFWTKLFSQVSLEHCGKIFTLFGLIVSIIDIFDIGNEHFHLTNLITTSEQSLNIDHKGTILWKGSFVQNLGVWISLKQFKVYSKMNIAKSKKKLYCNILSLQLKCSMYCLLAQIVEKKNTSLYNQVLTKDAHTMR